MSVTNDRTLLMQTLTKEDHLLNSTVIKGAKCDVVILDELSSKIVPVQNPCAALHAEHVAAKHLDPFIRGRLGHAGF